MAKKKKKSKLTPKQCPNDFARKVEIHQKNDPIKIHKYYLKKAFDKVSNYGTKVKRKDPVVENYREGGMKCLNICRSSSMDALGPNLLQPVTYTCTWTTLVSVLRKAILSHNWSYCLRLCEALLKYSALRRRQLLYLMRLIFLLLFNLKVSGEKIDNFLTLTMSIRSSEEKIAYLRSLSELKKFSVGKNKNKSATELFVNEVSFEEDVKG